jgi:hypothetical protein
MDQTKTFPLRTVLTVVTGRLLTLKTEKDNGIGDLYEILNWMTSDSVFTHQIPRAVDECSPVLKRLYPELNLAGSSLKDLDEWLSKVSDGSDSGVTMWITQLKTVLPEIKDEYEVPKLDTHIRRDPMQDLYEMIGDKAQQNVIVVEV